MISFDNLSKSYGSRLLFDNIVFNINPRERIGLIGRNGHGKSTLFKMIVGEESIDSGTISIPRNYRIGYLSQRIEFTKKTVVEEVIGEEDIDTSRYKAEKILIGLGFSMEDMDKSPDAFSGGYQVRLNLAKVLLEEPNLLLLDEPSNYLDLISLRWLKSFLLKWHGEVMLITHDKLFLDDIITHTVGIHRNKIRKIAGKTDNFYEQILMSEEIYEKTRVNEEQKRKDIEKFIIRFKSKASMASRAQSRVKSLAKMDQKDKLDKIRDLEFSFKHKPFTGKQLMRVDNLSFGYKSDELLIKDLSLIVGSEDRIGIIGKNGKGKSTLLKLLAGVLKPISGEITYYNGMEMGYYEQTNVSTLDESRTVEEEIASVSNTITRTEVRGIAASMLFTQDQALKKVNVLSGGEKSRVMLGKILAKPINLIIFDEPTNHLDMQAVDGLIDALDSFEGAMIIVTHNEMLLKAIANRLVVFEGDHPFLFEGNYDYFLEKVGFNDEVAIPKKNTISKEDRKEMKRIRAELITKKGSVMKKYDTEMKELEESINSSEERLTLLNADIISLSESGNGAKTVDISKEVSVLSSTIEELFLSLEKLDKERSQFIEEINTEMLKYKN